MFLVCLGDSLTYGYPYDSSLSWTTGLKNILGLENFNAGINGDTTSDMLARLDRDVISQKPTHACFMGGTNDIYIGEDLAKIENNYLTLTELLTEHKIVPILALMPPVADTSEETLKSLRSFIIELAFQKKLHVLDFYSIFLNSQGMMRMEYFCDDCHPNINGYKAMTDQAVTFFKRLL